MGEVTMGSPPHVRGKGLNLTHPSQLTGITPAYAGTVSYTHLTLPTIA